MLDSILHILALFLGSHYHICLGLSMIFWLICNKDLWGHLYVYLIWYMANQEEGEMCIGVRNTPLPGFDEGEAENVVF